MKKIHLGMPKRPDVKGTVHKLKNLKKEDVINWRREHKERRARIIEERRNSALAKKMKPVWLWMNRLSLIFHALLACVINLGIEAISRHSLFQAWEYMTGSPLVFLYNAFMIFATFFVVYFFKRRVFVRIIISVLWMVLGVCNGYMLIKRVTPFNAQDLKVAMDAVSLINNYFNPMELVLLAVGIAAVIVWIISMWRRGGQYGGKVRWWLALAGTIASFAGYLALTQAALDARVISNYFGNIAFAYEDYGLPYCFMASLFNTGIDEPVGYSEETIQKISNNREITKNETGREAEELPNIIFVQLESYFDVAEAEFFTTSEDANPNLREMYENYSSGYFKVPSVGAGTANTEFEVLTGMNMRFFGPGEYPFKTYLKERTAESAATALADLGYGTHGLHNNGGNFYSRARVYNNSGFDTFTSKEFMNILQTTENGWAKDEILVEHIVEAMDTTEQQDFVFAISVQGHGDYPEEKLIEEPKIKVEGIQDEGTKNKWEYYVNQVYEMDAFAGKLVETMEERGEPTVIVFYGDHLPTMGLQAEDLKSRYLYNTNYVIWDNIGLKKEDRNVPAYQIMADVFERLNIHAGTVFNYHMERRETRDYLADLELLQYDILYGNQYVYDGKPPITEGHMQMGVKDVKVTDLIIHLDEGYSLYGQNFTKSSKVYVNGEKQKSSFLNNTRIELPETKLAEGDVLTVSQVGSSNTVFRTSCEYIYEDGKLTEQPGTGSGIPGKSWLETTKRDEE